MTRLQETRKALESLPEPPLIQPNLKLIKLISAFCNKFIACVEGRENYEELMRSCRSIYRDFRGKIAFTHPNFIPFSKCSREAAHSWELTLLPEDDHVDACYPDFEMKPVRMDLDDMTKHIEE